MRAKSHIHQNCGRLPKKLFPAKGYADIQIQMPFFDNKNSIWIILGLKIRTVETCSSTSCTHRNLFIWKTLKSQFLVQFRSFIFGQILANFGSFGQFWVDLGRICSIHSGWEHARTWAEIFKTPKLLNRESKCYMQRLVGKLPSICIDSKSFKISKNLLHS
jgi:hypothetical protein